MNAAIESARKKGRHGDTILAHISPREALALTLNGGAGTKNPKTGLPEFFGWSDLNPFSGGGGGFVGSVLTGGLSDLYAGIEKYNEGGSFYDLLDRAVDPGGTVDRSIRGVGGTGFGQALSPVMDIAGPVVGGVVGGIYGGPAGAAGGAAAGSGFATKWKGIDNEEAAKKAAIAGGLAYVGGTVAQGAGGGGGAGLSETAGMTAEQIAAEGAPYGFGAVEGTTAIPGLESLAPVADAGTSQTVAPMTPVTEPTGGYDFYNPPATDVGAGYNMPVAAGATAGGTTGYDFFNPPAEDVSPAVNAPATEGGIMNTAGNAAKTGGQWVKDAGTGLMKWVGNNKAMTGLVGLSLLNSMNQQNLMEKANAGQQESYDRYLNALNPDETTKNAQLGALKSNIATQGTLAKRRIGDTLASRGITGKGTVAPLGDESEARRLAENAAYNQIFGKFNVPGVTPPVNAGTSAGNFAVGNASALMNQLLAAQLAKGA